MVQVESIVSGKSLEDHVMRISDLKGDVTVLNDDEDNHRRNLRSRKKKKKKRKEKRKRRRRRRRKKRNRKANQCPGGTIKVFTYKIEIQVRATSQGCSPGEESDVGKVLDKHFDGAFGSGFGGGAGAITRMNSYVCHRPTNATQNSQQSLVKTTEPPVAVNVPAPVAAVTVEPMSPAMAPPPTTETSMVSPSNDIDNVMTTPSPTAPICRKWFLSYKNSFEEQNFVGWHNVRRTKNSGFSMFMGQYCGNNDGPWRIFKVPSDAEKGVCF